MGTAPITLDFSKAQPINGSADVQKQSTSGVQLDFSKAEYLPGHEPDKSPEQTQAEQAKNESLNRTEMLSGMTGMPVPGQNKEEFEKGKTAGMVSGLATVPAVAGATAAADGLPALYESLTAPSYVGGSSVLDKTVELLARAKPFIDGLEKLGIGAGALTYVIKSLHEIANGSSK